MFRIWLSSLSIFLRKFHRLNKLHWKQEKTKRSISSRAGSVSWRPFSLTNDNQQLLCALVSCGKAQTVLISVNSWLTKAKKCSQFSKNFRKPTQFCLKNTKSIDVFAFNLYNNYQTIGFVYRMLYIVCRRLETEDRKLKIDKEKGDQAIRSSGCTVSIRVNLCLIWKCKNKPNLPAFGRKL